MSKELSENEVEWIAFLIGKIKEAQLSPENKLRLEQERAVKEAQVIAGEVPLREWPII